MDEFQRELTKLDVNLLQRLRSALNDDPEASGEAVETKGDNVKTDVMATVKDKNGPNNPNNPNEPNEPNDPQYCLCNKGSAGIMVRCDNVEVSLNSFPRDFRYIFKDTLIQKLPD